MPDTTKVGSWWVYLQKLNAITLAPEGNVLHLGALRTAKPILKGKEISIPAENRPGPVDTFMAGPEDVHFEADILEAAIAIVHSLSGEIASGLSGSTITGSFYGRKPKWKLMAVRPDGATLNWAALTSVTADVFEFGVCTLGSEGIEIFGVEDGSITKLHAKPESKSEYGYIPYMLKYGVAAVDLIPTGTTLPTATLYVTHP